MSKDSGLKSSLERAAAAGERVLATELDKDRIWKSFCTQYQRASGLTPLPIIPVTYEGAGRDVTGPRYWGGGQAEAPSIREHAIEVPDITSNYPPFNFKS